MAKNLLRNQQRCCKKRAER